MGFLSRIKGTFGRSFNSLDSTPLPTQTPQSADSKPSFEPPPKKRQKTAQHSGGLPRGPYEEIEDFPQNSPTRSWSRIESPSLSASSVSSYLQEMGSFGGQDQHTRNDRRRRHPSADDDTNSCKQDYIDPPRQHRTTSYGGVKSDGADSVILEGIKGKSSTPKQIKARKRLNHETHGHDELALAHTPNQGKKRLAPSSVSRRGDLTPTQFSTKTSASSVKGNRHTEFRLVPVSAAACYDKYLYAVTDESACFLYPMNHDKSAPELCAIMDDRTPHPQQCWLRITSKAKTLHHNPDSPYLKISQATDINLKLGSRLMIKFETPAYASAVVNWIRDNIEGADILEETCQRLLSTWDKTCSEVNRQRSTAKAAETESTSKQTIDDLPRNVSASISPSQVSPSSRSRTTIRDGMQVSVPATPKAVTTYGRRSSRIAKSTKSVELDLSLSPESPPPPPRWSQQNRGWIDDWKKPLRFGRVELTKEDISRLDEDQLLNDNIIEFGLKYLFERYHARHPDLKRRVYVHNSFFYTSLTGTSGNKFNYDAVKRWTAKVDLLSHDYIVVPINQNFHWWVAIICNPGKLDPDARRKAEESTTSSDFEMTEAPPLVTSDVVDLATDDKDPRSGRRLQAQPKQRKTGYSLDDPRILLLDSLGSGHSPTVKYLRQYLVAEFQDKRGKTLNANDLPKALGMKAVNIPQQSNLTDCGVFLLGYMQEFVQAPDQLVEALLSKEKMEWPLDASDLRTLWRDTIFKEKRFSQTGLYGVLGESGATYRNGETSLPANSAKPVISTAQVATEAVPGATKPLGDASRQLSEQVVESVEIATPPAQEAAEHPVAPTGPEMESTTDHTDNHMDFDDSVESPTPEPPSITDLSTLSCPSMDLVRHQNGLPKLTEPSSPKPANSPGRQSSQAEDDVDLIPTHDMTYAKPQPVVGSEKQPPTNPLFTARVASSSPTITTSGDENDNEQIQEVDAVSFYKSSAPQTAAKAKAPQLKRSVPLGSPTRASQSRHPNVSSPPTWNPKRPNASSPPSRGSRSHAARPNGMSSPAGRQRSVATSAATRQPFPHFTTSALAPTRAAMVAENLEAVKHQEPISIVDDSE
ncbi:putative ubiquitin-like-specific protease [Triangularia verruculosa]|uniref:Ubiquitin-like-specific protease n=1 Tax=Triangularia verruculosa TaxID=2587418 RepID=A0AAN6XQK8_9PEZI|nr:putative ubiquitin-like-specific protease [Triangularia verruculosa]